ncbi:hypothetical protein HK339_04600, partial [Streptococcus agalactiae]|nr:hypothetical protein [Streptococcus agalactiae]
GKHHKLTYFKDHFGLVESSLDGYHISRIGLDFKFKLTSDASLKVIYKGQEDPYSHQKEDATKKSEQLDHSNQFNQNTAKVTFANIDWSHYDKVIVDDKEDIKSRGEITLNKG